MKKLHPCNFFIQKFKNVVFKLHLSDLPSWQGNIIGEFI